MISDEEYEDREVREILYHYLCDLAEREMTVAPSRSRKPHLYEYEREKE